MKSFTVVDTAIYSEIDNTESSVHEKDRIHSLPAISEWVDFLISLDSLSAAATLRFCNRKRIILIRSLQHVQEKKLLPKIDTSRSTAGFPEYTLHTKFEFSLSLEGSDEHSPGFRTFLGRNSLVSRQFDAQLKHARPIHCLTSNETFGW